MQLSRYAEIIRTRSTCRTEHDPMAYVALGLASEAGEVAGEIHKSMREGRALSVAKVIAELGDTLWFLTYLADMLGYSLEELASCNIEKLIDRSPELYQPSECR